MRKPVIAAVNGVCAGRRPALRRRRRHRDRGVRRHVLRPARVARAGRRVRGHRARPEVADGADPAHGARRAARAHDRARGRYQLGILSEVVDPPERLRDAGPRSSAATIARNSPAAMAATKRALWGALEAGLTDACRAGGAAPRRRCGAIPTRRRDRGRSPRSASASWQDLAPATDVVSLADARCSSRRGRRARRRRVHAGDATSTRAELLQRTSRSATRSSTPASAPGTPSR